MRGLAALDEGSTTVKPEAPMAGLHGDLGTDNHSNGRSHKKELEGTSMGSNRSPEKEERRLGESLLDPEKMKRLLARTVLKDVDDLSVLEKPELQDALTKVKGAILATVHDDDPNADSELAAAKRQLVAAITTAPLTSPKEGLLRRWFRRIFRR